MRTTRTGSITTAVINFLNLIGFFAWENKTVGIWDAQKNIYRKPARHIKGASDIIATDWFGRIICVEIKTGADRLSADQTIYATEIVGRGGVYLIVQNIQDLIDGLRFYGYDLNDSGYVKSKTINKDWLLENAFSGKYCIPNSNKLKKLNAEETAKISTAIRSEGLKTILARIFNNYAERILK